MSKNPPTDATPPRARAWPQATLRATLVIISLVATLPLALALGLRIVSDSDERRAVLNANLQTTARAVATAVDREMAASRDALDALAKGEALQRGDLASFEQRLRSRGPLRESWNRLALLDAQGRLIFEVDRASDVRRVTPATSPARVQAIAAAWSKRPAEDLLIDFLDGVAADSATWIAIPTTMPDGRHYLLASRVGVDVWQRLIEGLAPADGYVTLFDAQRRIVARTLDPQRFVGQPLPAAAVAGMGQSPSGHQKTALAGGGETYAAWQLLRRGDWGVGVGVDAAPFDAAQSRALFSAFGGGLICVLLGVGLSLWAARRVSEPLQRLARGQSLGPDERISVTEIAQLRDAFQQSEQARAAASADLTLKAAEFETLFRNCPTGLAFTQDPACTSVQRNAAMNEMLPAANGQAEAPGVEVYADGERLAASHQPLAVAARERRAVPPVELEVRRPGQPPAYLLASAVPMPDGRGALASVTDVTARRTAERERDELMTREQLARRDAESASHAKDELLSMLGHELRNPLNALVTSAEVLRCAPPGSTIADSARGVVSRQTRKLSMLIDRLLDVGRIMADDITLAIEPVELQNALSGSVAAAMPQALERQHRLALDAPVPVWVRADPARISQVMMQLLDNALKHTPAGAIVTVALRREGDDAVVSVSDTGPGIDAGLLPKIFEPFVQGRRGLDRASGGLGVGLALVKRLIELQGGSVAAASSDSGSVFSWRLPASAAPETGPGALSRRVGVVDDNPDALASMRHMLELAGHRVSTAADGPAGLAMVLAERPDIALVDIGLPGIDGYEIARRCRSAGYRGRMIALSGYGLAHDLKRSAAEGFDAHLVKPVDPDRLLALLHQD